MTEFWQKVALATLSLMLVVALTWLIYAVDERDRKTNRPESYADTVSVILPSLQGAKAAAVKANDKERYEYWTKIESDLLEKVMNEKGEANDD